MNEQDAPQEMTEILKNIAAWQKTHQKPTLNEIEDAVEVELDKLRRQLIERLVAESQEESEEVSCPACGEPMMRNGPKKRRLKGRGDEEIELEREQYRCHQCGMTLFPPG